MATIEMIEQLRNDWEVLIYTHPDDGQAVVELYPKRSRIPEDMVARYVDPGLERAITRAFHGDAADG